MSVSRDCSCALFTSPSTEIVPGQVDTNDNGDVFLYARGASADPAISADGRSILFSSTAGDLVAQDFNSTVDIFLDRAPTTPGAFFTVPPCRIADSRVADTPLSSSVPQTLALHAACGVPSAATAVSVNVTVVAGSSAGFVTLFPGDQPVPATSTLNFRAGQVKANNAVARLALDGSGTLGIVASFGDGLVHVIVDVNGYFE